MSALLLQIVTSSKWSLKQQIQVVSRVVTLGCPEILESKNSLDFFLSHSILVHILLVEAFHIIALLLASAHLASAPAYGQHSSERAQGRWSNPEQNLQRE